MARARRSVLDLMAWSPKNICSNLTIVIEAMGDLVANDHSYSPKVEGLVLMFAEERRLQDSCWKNLSEREKKEITRHTEPI